MKEFIYKNIVDGDGTPIRELVTEEEFDRRTQTINDTVNFLKGFMSNERTLNVTSTEDAKNKISDVEVVGNPNLFRLLCKASSKSQGWMKSTKAMQVAGGVVLQVSTQQNDVVAEALTYVPGVKIVNHTDGYPILVGL